MPKVDDNLDNVNVCLKYCGPCLTYPEVDGEALFCSRGKSSAPKEKQGCNCGVCDVKRKYLCQGAYFCISGACE